MRGDLLTKTRKLVKGLAKAKPIWLKAMEEAPPVTFPCTDGKVEKISLPEDIYIKKFFQKHKKGSPSAQGSCHCGVWGGSDVRSLTPASREAVSSDSNP